MLSKKCIIIIIGRVVLSKAFWAHPPPHRRAGERCCLLTVIVLFYHLSTVIVTKTVQCQGVRTKLWSSMQRRKKNRMTIVVAVIDSFVN